MTSRRILILILCVERDVTGSMSASWNTRVNNSFIYTMTGWNKKTSTAITHARNMWRQFPVFYLQLPGVSTSDRSRAAEVAALMKKRENSSKRKHQDGYPSLLCLNYVSTLIIIYIPAFLLEFDSSWWRWTEAMNAGKTGFTSQLHHRIDRQDATRRSQQH